MAVYRHCMLYRLWQKGIGDVSEREAMTQLLVALKTVKGFDERARELAQSSGKDKMNKTISAMYY